MTSVVRPFVGLPRAPEQYDVRDQTELRRAIAVALDSVSVAGGNQTTTLTGDVTGTGVTSIVTTLATVNSNTGAFGSSTAIPTVTVNAKGLITAVSTNAVIAPAGTLTGTTLAANVVTSSLTTIGTLVAGAVPASLVTAGTFGTGTYAIAGGSSTNALIVTTTGAIQQSLRYDSSNRLDIAVGGSGIVTFTPVGAAARVVIGLLTLTASDMSYAGGGFTVENTAANQFNIRYSTTGGLNSAMSVNSSGNLTIGPVGAYNDKNLSLKYRVSIGDESGSFSISDSTALNLPAATTTLSSLRLAHGTAPSSPVDGDVWTDTTSAKVRINGTTHFASWAEQSTISDPSGGGVQDAEARTAINAIIDALQATNIIA